MKRILGTILLVVFGMTTMCAGAEELKSAKGPGILSWGEMLDQIKMNPSFEPARSDVIAKARKAAAEPIIRRAYTLADVGKNRTWLDGRSRALEDEIRETFALAMSDFSACQTLADELPCLAAAYRLSGENVFRDRIIAQLEEMALWSPLQRPGWTLYAPGHRLSPEGKDGNWLATGCGVRAIGNTLDVLPPNTLSPDLENKLHTLLESEVAGVVDDWRTKRSWFIRENNPVTNQWVLPTEGLIRACLILGVDAHRDAYELGVKNLLMALDAHGKNGEFEEGFGYATFTVTSLLHAGHAMAVTGDRRALDHPFLKNFPFWLVHHFQPGNMVINCFDAGGAMNGAKRTQPLFSLLAVCTASPVARWALYNQMEGPSDDLAGLAARALPPVTTVASPPLFAYYERATRVNWRDQWTKDASGVWVRGGHPLDQHDHQDRGHVNFIARGHPILIEAGTPVYSHKLMLSHYRSCIGHNVLQLGVEPPPEHAEAGKIIWLPGWQKSGGVAPISVRWLEQTGGEVVVDGSACYEDLKKWLRTVSWTSNKLNVKDEVVLAQDQGDFVLFRWHLGTERDVVIKGEGTKYTVTWPEARMVLKGNKPLIITQVKLPDNTLEGHDGSENPKNFHICVVVQTQNKQAGLILQTKVVPIKK